MTSGEHIPAHTVVSLGSTAISNITSAVSGSVVSISNFPSTQTIAGTVTANVQGTITAGMLLVEDANNSFPNQNAPVQLKANPTNGSLRVRMDYLASADPANDSASVVGNTNANETGNTSYVKAKVVAGSVTIGSLPPISGTVTANNPSGALTTRFGSVATANLAFITSAVTNTSRKYLLAQNISAGTVTIGIGFSPTTTQGIQLTAGGGLTFDAFCPTGAVYWLGAVTGAAFTILEG